MVDRLRGLSEVRFADAMAALASGVAVVTARQRDGRPCGLAATSISSYTSNPPSVLVVIGHASRCHGAVAETGTHFGVHLLRADQRQTAETFAARGEDKFAGLDWSWDEGVPQLAGALVYLRCRRSAAFRHYDHTILVGDAEGGYVEDDEPLVYLARRMDWRFRHPT